LPPRLAPRPPHSPTTRSVRTTMRRWELAKFDGWVSALDCLGRRTRPATQTAPPPDSIHAPASLACHHEREEKADEPRETRNVDSNDLHEENARRPLTGSATS
jgi:hypothetical protein